MFLDKHSQGIAVWVHQLLGQFMVRHVSSALRIIDSKQCQQGVIVKLHPKGLTRVPEVLIVHPSSLALVKHVEQLSELEGVVVVVTRLNKVRKHDIVRTST